MTLPPSNDSRNTSYVNQRIPQTIKDFVITEINTAVSNGLFRIQVIIPTEMTVWGLPLMWWLKYSGYLSVYKNLEDTTGQLTIQW